MNVEGLITRTSDRQRDEYITEMRVASTIKEYQEKSSYNNNNKYLFQFESTLFYLRSLEMFAYCTRMYPMALIFLSPLSDSC